MRVKSNKLSKNKMDVGEEKTSEKSRRRRERVVKPFSSYVEKADLTAL